MDVLVTNAWGRTSYNVVRNLGLRGLKVAVGTDRYRGMAALSRHAAARFRHPVVTFDAKGFVDAVRQAIRRYSPAVYIPIGEDVYLASRYLDMLAGSGAAIPIAPYAAISTLHEKDQSAALAASLGIPVPKTISPKSADDVMSFAKEHGYPVVLKSVSSSSGRAVSYLDAAHLAEAAARIVAWDDYIVQQCVPGTGYGVSMLFNRGRLRAKFTHRRLQELPPSGGISTLRVAVVQPELEQYAQRLLEHLGFHGVAMIEFKRDDRTGANWFIEANPRFWGSLALAIESGVDFPYLLFRMARDGDVEPVLKYRSGTVVKWMLGDAARRFVRGARSSPSAASARPDAYDDIHWDDPIATIGGVALAAWKRVATRSWRSAEFNVNTRKLASSTVDGARIL